MYFEDIIKYAIKQIELGEENLLVYELISIYDFEPSLCSEILYKLSKIENSNYEIEYRKIRAVIVYKSLLKKSNNYINGIYDLYDLYFSLGEPKDIPIIIQGLNNKINVQELYTQQMYEYIYNRVKNWLDNELNTSKNTSGKI